MPDNESKFVRWITFVWVVGIVSVLMGAMFFMIISLMTSFSDIRSDVSAIKTDVTWIKRAIGNNEISKQVSLENYVSNKTTKN